MKEKKEKSQKYIVYNNKNKIGTTHGIDSAIYLCEQFGTHVVSKIKSTDEKRVVFEKQ